MSDLLWSRRSILKLLAASSGALLVPQIELPAAAPVPAPPIVSGWPTASDARLIQLGVHSVGDTTKEVLRFAIGRVDGTVLMEVALNPRAMFMWVAAPGYEIVVGPGLVNLSDADLEVHYGVFEHRGQRYAWTPRAGTIAMEATT